MSTKNNSMLEVRDDSGLLFPTEDGVRGAIRVNGIMYEVSSSSHSEYNGKKALNIVFKRLGGKKLVQISLYRSGFEGANAPTYISTEFKMDGVDYQIVGWSKLSTKTGKSFYSLAINEMKQYDML